MSSHHDPDFDALLGQLLAPPGGPGDRGFTMKVDRAIDARAAYARAQGRFWRSFTWEMLAISALLTGLWLLSKQPLFAAFPAQGQWGQTTPMLLILLLWFATQRRRHI